MFDMTDQQVEVSAIPDTNRGEPPLGYVLECSVCGLLGAVATGGEDDAAKDHLAWHGITVTWTP